MTRIIEYDWSVDRPGSVAYTLQLLHAHLLHMRGFENVADTFQRLHHAHPYRLRQFEMC